MPKFAANLSFLYSEFGFLERFGAAAADGFSAVEYMSPYDVAAEDIADQLAKHGLTQALFNLPSGDWAGGERGIACLPDRVSEFRQGVDKAIAYARTLGCSKINCLAGLAPTGADPAELERTLIENLRYAAPRMAEAGIMLLLEPVNTVDVEGFFISRTDHALRILDAVGADNAFLQYDFYHAQVMQGDLIATFARHKDRIGHVQIADNPGRNEPGTGEINYGVVFSELDRLGYDGFVGCEYKPRGKTSDGLDWMKPYI